MQHKQILCYYEAHGMSVVKQVLTNLNSGKWYYIYNYQYCFSKQERLVTRHQSSVSTNCLTAWGMVRELWGLVSPSITPCPKTIYYCSQTLYSNWLGAKKKKNEIYEINLKTPVRLIISVRGFVYACECHLVRLTQRCDNNEFIISPQKLLRIVRFDSRVRRSCLAFHLM